MPPTHHPSKESTRLADVAPQGTQVATIRRVKAGRKNNFYKLVLLRVAENAMTRACKDANVEARIRRKFRGSSD